MFKMILFLLMTVPQQGGKVILETGVPAADLYLDGNFVAATDGRGMLTMENFPAGSFSYSIVKKGYRPFKGSFSINEGETRRLSPTLEKIPEPEEPRKEIFQRRKESPPADRSSTTHPRQEAAEESAQSPAGDMSVKTPVATQSGTRRALTEEGTKPIWLISYVLLTIAIIFLVAAILTRRRRAQSLSHMAIGPDPEIPSPSADAANRPDPGFIEALKRREELINAGYVSGKSRTMNQDSMKEKEVVIVLPKEAFRVEDDK